MTLTNVSAAASLLARMAGTQTGVAGSVQLGASTTDSFTDADIFYSCKVRGLNITNNATLDLAAGTWTVTGYTVVDGDGKDWEGNTLSTMVTLYAILVVGDSANTQKVALSETGVGLYHELQPGEESVWMLVYPAGAAVDTVIFDLGFSSTGAPAINNATIHVLGKSS